MEGELIARGFEIGLALAKPLAELVAEELGGGLDEQAATKKALERLAATKDIEPVLPKIEAKIEAALRPKDGADATTAVGPALAYDRRIVERILGNVVLSHEERAALRALIGTSP
jgi:hypothetical protein